MFKVINPALCEIVREYDGHTSAHVNAKIDAAYGAFRIWRKNSFEIRALYMLKMADLLMQKKNDFAKLMAVEMGKPVSQGLGEVEKCASVCEYYAAHTKGMLDDEIVYTDAARSFVSYQPLGIVLAVMPWNFPFWQVFRFAVPALMAGNAAILKHASNVPGCALAIEHLFEEAGFPQGVFGTLLIGSEKVKDVIEHPKIMAVTLTGSTPAGRSVASHAGQMLKKTVLELGGSDAYLVLSDANVDKAAEICAQSRLINGGQSCIAAKRFIVVESQLAMFEQRFVEAMKKVHFDDPLKPETLLGPMAREDLRDELHEQVKKSVAQGARVLLGGEKPSQKGAWYPPTVLSDVRPGMVAFDDELFGPVAAIISAKNDEHAIELANQSVFGLGAAVFTTDLDKGQSIAVTELEAGCCFVNALVRSDPRLPFGGIKQSGYGRELSSFGIREFVNIKTVYVANS